MMLSCHRTTSLGLTKRHAVSCIPRERDFATTVVPPSLRRTPDPQLYSFRSRVCRDPFDRRSIRVGPIIHSSSKLVNHVLLSLVVFVLYRPGGEDVEYPRLGFVQVGLVKHEDACVHRFGMASDIYVRVHHLFHPKCSICRIPEGEVQESVWQDLRDSLVTHHPASDP